VPAVFQYGVSHNLTEVGSADYIACSATNSIQSYSDQESKINLTKPDARYFFCSTSGVKLHGACCDAGRAVGDTLGD
jgi:hypothetical protein